MSVCHGKHRVFEGSYWCQETLQTYTLDYIVNEAEARGQIRVLTQGQPWMRCWR